MRRTGHGKGVPMGGLTAVLVVTETLLPRAGELGQLAISRLDALAR